MSVLSSVHGRRSKLGDEGFVADGVRVPRDVLPLLSGSVKPGVRHRDVIGVTSLDVIQGRVRHIGMLRSCLCVKSFLSVSGTL